METVLSPLDPPSLRSTTVTTSLYELIEALQETAGPEEDDLIVATVMYLLESGRITFPRRHAGTMQCN